MSQHTGHLGTKPILGLFFGMAAPIAVGMLVHGLYNVVDAIFVTRIVGIDAMGGISIVFPIQMLVFAVITLIGHGMASIVSRHLGAKNDEAAQATTDMALRLSLVLGIVVSAAIYFNMAAIFEFIGVSETLAPYAYEYLTPLALIGFPLIFIGNLPGDILRAEGKAMIMMISMVLSAVVNILLDAIFIYGLDMGVAGAAYGTILSQVFGIALVMYFFLTGKTHLKITLFAYKFDWQVVKNIVILGIPILISHAGVSIFIGFTNYSLSQFSDIDNDLYISAYGLIGRCVMFAILPLIAMTIAFQTIAGYNYGAQLYGRVRQVIKVGLIACMSYGTGMSLLMILVPEPIIGIFSSDIELINVTTSIALWVFLFFPLSNAHALISALFQAIGKARQAIFLSSLRIYFLMLPALIVLPALYGLDGLWWAYPVADVVAFTVVVYFLFRERRNLNRLDLVSKQPAPNKEA